MLARRDFVKGGVSLITLGAGVNSLLKGTVAFARANPPDVMAPYNGKILILVQCAGGNDGLRTLIPLENSAYRSARPTTGIADEEALPLESGFGLHPDLNGLKDLWDRGKLAVVQGAGYPNQNYSHFKSMAIWQYADPELRALDGWLGRTLADLEAEEHDPFQGFNIGSSTPLSLRTPEVAVPSVRDPADYGFKLGGRPVTAEEERAATLVKLYEEYPSTAPFGVLLETTAESAVSSSALLAEAGRAYEPAVAYPNDAFATGLSVLAQAIVGGLGMRVGHITLGGFDTHSAENGQHDALMETLGDGLAAFHADLEAHGLAENVLVLTWSEFGRRVKENGNGGTDHGSASVMFALGDGVAQGIYGDPPSLTDLIDSGNLAYTTDFRRVYATVVERWFGAPSEQLLGDYWEPLGFLPAL
ncbi:MAG: DUF1501 domain-containing protein [Dehalococcoidia bacterium]